MLTEITTGSVLVGLLLGLFALALADTFGRRSVAGDGSGWRALAFNQFTGAVLGGILAGVVTGPLENFYFGQQPRSFLSPQIMLPGALMGATVIVFSIINYDLERANLKRLAVSAALAVASSIVSGLAAAGSLLEFDVPSRRARHCEDNPTGQDTRSVAGRTVLRTVYGILVGAILGAAMGLTLLSVAGREPGCAIADPAAGTR